MDHNQKDYFAQDLISEPFPIDTTIYAGAYSGVLNGKVDTNNAEQPFTVEIYKADSNGNPIASGISGQPIGDLGVQVIAIAESGLIDLQSGNESQFSISAELTQNLTLLNTQRIRYHVSAEKVGTSGGGVDIEISYGFDHVAHLDIPIQATTDNVINLSTVPGATSGDALEFLDNNKLDSELTANDGIFGNSFSLDLGIDILNGNLSFYRVNSIQGLEQYSGVYPFVTDGVKVIKDPGTHRIEAKSGTFDSYQQLNPGQFTAQINDNGNSLASQINQTEAGILLLLQDSVNGNFGVLNMSATALQLQSQSGANVTNFLQTPNEFSLENGIVKINTVNQNDANTKVLSVNTLTNELEFIDKSSIGGGGANSTIIVLEFVKAQNVNTQTTLESHSSFGNVAPFYASPVILPPGISSAELVGFDMFSTLSSVTQASTASFSVRTQPVSNRVVRPFGGGTLRYQNTALSSTSAQGQTPYESIKDTTLYSNPIPIGIDDMVFVDFDPQFWTLQDINAKVYVRVTF